jgi:hypothetical protein
MSNVQRWKTKERLVEEKFFGEQKVIVAEFWSQHRCYARATWLSGQTTNAFEETGKP